MMNKKTIIISIITLAIAVIVGGFWYTKNQKNIIKPVDIIKDVQDDVGQKEEGEIVSENDENIEELRIEDEDSLFDAFLEYLKSSDDISFSLYKDKKLNINVFDIKNIDDKIYLKSIIWVDGQHSTPEVLAVMENNQWTIIFRGQDYPSCDILDKYNFPKNIKGLDKCFILEDNVGIDLVDRK